MGRKGVAHSVSYGLDVKDNLKPRRGERDYCYEHATEMLRIWEEDEKKRFSVIVCFNDMLWLCDC
jgi:hypothetical protein